METALMIIGLGTLATTAVVGALFVATVLEDRRARTHAAHWCGVNKRWIYDPELIANGTWFRCTCSGGCHPVLRQFGLEDNEAVGAAYADRSRN